MHVKSEVYLEITSRGAIKDIGEELPLIQDKKRDLHVNFMRGLKSINSSVENNPNEGVHIVDQILEEVEDPYIVGGGPKVLTSKMQEGASCIKRNVKG